MSAFQEIEKARVARLVSITTKFVGICAVLYGLLIILLTTEREWYLRLIAPTVILVSSVLSLSLSKRGYVLTAGRVMAVMLWGVILLLTVMNQNGSTLAVSGFIMGMLFSSVFVDVKWMIGLGLVNGAAHVIGNLLILNGVYQPPLVLSSTVNTILSVFFIIATSGTLTIYIYNLKAALMEAVESEALFRAMFENSLEAKFLITPEGNVVRANRAATEMYGYTEAEFQQGGSELVLKQAIDPNVPHLVHQREGREQVRGEFTVKDRSGKPITIEFTSTRFKTPKGVDQLVISNLDITERKQAEEDLRQQNELLETIVDSIPVMIVFFDEQGQFKFVNGEWERTLGYTLEECQQHPDIITAFYPDPQVRQQALSFMAAAPARWEDFDIVTREGRRLKTTWRNVRFSNGRSIGIGQDVTERRQAERALQQYAERLEIINQIERAIIEAQNPDVLAHNTLHHVCQIIPCERASLILFDRANDQVQFHVVDSVLPSKVPVRSVYPLNQDWAARLEKETLLITPDLHTIPNPPPLVQALIDEDFQSQVSVALKTRDEVIGAMNLTFKSPLNLKEGDTQILQEIAAQLSVAVQQTRLYKKVQEYARELEERVAERTAALEELINTLPEYIFVVEKNGMQITFCNDRFAQVSGFKDRHAVQGKTIYECFPSDQADYFAAQNRIVFETGETLHTEETLELPTGTHYMDTFKIPLKNVRGEVYALITTSHDLTDIMALQKGLEEATEALKLSEARYRTVVETQTEIVSRFLPDTTLTFVNNAYCQQFGKSESELIGMRWIEIIPEAEQERNLAYIHSLIENPRTEYNETTVMTAGGEVRWQRWYNIPLLDERGQVVEFQAGGIDITERKIAENAILHLNEQLQQSNTELESFSYSVSHDLRAPLRAIDGFSRILTDTYLQNLPEQGQHYLRRVRENAERMGLLIDDLLTLSRVGRRDLRKRTVEPTALVRQILMDWGDERLNPKAEIVVHDMPSVLADPGLLRQVYDNLISNALKYSQHVNEPIVEVGYTIRNSEKVYFVKDNGVGFDMRYADKLFGVFQRLHTNEQYEGTGIGLAIVHQIVRRHGGRIWADGEVNKGATFYFTLGAKDA